MGRALLEGNAAQIGAFGEGFGQVRIFGANVVGSLGGSTKGSESPHSDTSERAAIFGERCNPALAGLVIACRSHLEERGEGERSPATTRSRQSM